MPTKRWVCPDVCSQGVKAGTCAAPSWTESELESHLQLQLAAERRVQVVVVVGDVAKVAFNLANVQFKARRWLGANVRGNNNNNNSNTDNDAGDDDVQRRVQD